MSGVIPPLSHMLSWRAQGKSILKKSKNRC